MDYTPISGTSTPPPDNPLAGLPLYGAFSPERALEVVCRDMPSLPGLYGVHAPLVVGDGDALGRGQRVAFWLGYFRDSVGSYIVIHPYSAEHIHRAVREHGGRDVAAVHKGLRDIGIPSLHVCPWEADEGSLEEQWASIKRHEDLLGLRIPLVVMSGDTRPGSMRAAGLRGDQIVPGKSLHSWMTVQPLAATEQNYALWKKVMRLHVGLHGSDPAIINKGRLMRTPGVVGGGAWGKGDLHRIQTIVQCVDPGAAPTLQEYHDRLTKVWDEQGLAPVDDVFEAVVVAHRLLHLAKKKPTEEEIEIRAEGRRILTERDHGLTSEDRELAGIILGREVDSPPSPRSPTKKGKRARSGSRLIEWDAPVRAKTGEEHSLRTWASIVPTTREQKVPCFCPSTDHTDYTPSAVIFTTDSGVPYVHCSACPATYWPPRDSILSPTWQAGSGQASTRYLGPLTLMHTLTIINADTGTGKTTSLALLVANAMRVLVLVHRRSLALMLAYEFSIACYLDAPEGLIFEDKVVVCVDSLCRIPLTAPGGDLINDGVQGFDLVVIEESESVLEHLMGGTIPITPNEGRATSGEIHDHLVALLRATVAGGGKVVTTDGLTTDFTIGSMMAMTALPDKQVIEHHLDLDDHELIEHEHRTDIVGAFIQAVEAGERVALASTSAALVRRLQLYLEATTGPDGRKLTVLAYHREMDESAREQLRDVNSTWRSADVVLYSPSVDTGISYNPSDAANRFDKLFVIGERVPGLGFGKLLQMRHRCREMKVIHWWISSSYGHRMPIDGELIRRELIHRWIATRTYALAYVEKDGRVVPHISDAGHFEHGVRAELHRRRQWAAVHDDWSAWWASKKAKMLKANSPSMETRASIKALLKALREDESEQYARQVVAEARLTLSEYRDLRQRGPGDAQEARALERARVLDNFGSVHSDLVIEDRHRQATRAVARIVQAGLILDRLMEHASGFDQATLETGYRVHCRASTAQALLMIGLLQAALGGQMVKSVLTPLLTASKGGNAAVNDPGFSVVSLRETRVIDTSELQTQWTGQLLLQGGFLARIRSCMSKLPAARQHLKGTGVNFRQIETKPAAVLGKILGYYGLRTINHGRPTIGGVRATVYGLDLDRWEQIMERAQRMNDRARNELVTHFDDLEPVVVGQLDDNAEVIDLVALLGEGLLSTGTTG